MCASGIQQWEKCKLLPTSVAAPQPRTDASIVQVMEQFTFPFVIIHEGLNYLA